MGAKVTTESQAAFARRRQVSRKTVTEWKSRGLVSMTPDGLVKVEESEWLLADRPAKYRGGTTNRAAASDRPKLSENESPEQAADRIVRREGRAPYDHAEAVRIKENYLALLRQLEYDRESGAVVAVEDVGSAVAAEYAVIRNNILGLPAKAAPRLAMLRSANEVKALLEAEITKILEDLTLDLGGGADDDDLCASVQTRFATSH